MYRMSLRMKVEDPAPATHQAEGDAAEVIGGEIDHGVGYPTDEETETDQEDLAVSAHETDTDQEDPAVAAHEVDSEQGDPAVAAHEADTDQGDPAVAAHETDTNQHDPEPDTEDEAEVLPTNDRRRRRNSSIGMVFMGTRSKTKRIQALVDFLPPPTPCKRAARCLEDFNSGPWC